MSDFYREDQVRAAQDVLNQLRTIVPDAVILGGWAVYLYTRGQRSTDVDIAVDFLSLSRLQKDFPGQVVKNNNLRKYELKIGNVEIDILAVHFSNAGIPIEELLEPTQNLLGFRVMSREGLLAMKLCAWLDRLGRPKGDKDEADVLSLLMGLDFDWDRYRLIISKAEGKYRSALIGAIARLVTSADMRSTWRFIKINGESMASSTQQWKAIKSKIVTKLPRNL